MRFPGFEGEWVKKRLGDIAEFKAGYAFKSEDMLSEKSSYQLLKMSNVYQSELRLDRNPSYLKNITDKQREFLLKKGDSILTLTGTVGKTDFGYSVMIEEDNKYLLNQRLVLLREAKGKSDNGFIKQILSNDRFLFYFFGEAKGGTGNQTNVGTEDVKNIQLNFPNIREQIKISNFLSLIDRRIATQIKIIENLKVQMLGLQERIFRRKIKMKYENGKSFPEWELRNGGDLFFSTSNKKHNSDLPILAITQDQGAVPRDSIDYQISVTDKSVDSYKVVEVGDFIISLRSFQGGIEYSNYYGICSPAYIILKSKHEVENLFYKYYFKTTDYIKLLNKKLEGIRDGKMISFTYFSEIPLPYPSVEEQAKIANLLLHFDQKIELEKRMLKEYENEKQYLLQNLFI